MVGEEGPARRPGRITRLFHATRQSLWAGLGARGQGLTGVAALALAASRAFWRASFCAAGSRISTDLPSGPIFMHRRASFRVRMTSLTSVM